MEQLKVIASLIVLLSVIMISSATLPVFAQSQVGGVDHPGEWFPGENLEIGDYFSFDMCHANYKDCTTFSMDMWVEKEFQDGTEQKLLIQTVVRDGNKIISGEMEVGKIAPEPTGGTDNISPYRSAYKTSIVWLSAFATSPSDVGGKGPKAFSIPSWGKIGNIGGEQVIPMALDTAYTPAGTFETVVIGWHTGGKTSKVWVVDDFPFPVKASTWVQVSEGIPPQEYRFELLDHAKNITENPFTDIVDTEQAKKDLGCPREYDLTTIKKNTKTAGTPMTLNVFYGPTPAVTGCDLELRVDFKKSHAPSLWENQVHYDFYVLDESGKDIVRSFADEEGFSKFFSASGQVVRYMPVLEDPGTAKYVIWVHGTGPEKSAPDPSTTGFLMFDLEVIGDKPSTPKSNVAPKSTASTESEIPGWIKNNAGWWADGVISDSDFVSGIQYLINQKIMVIPPTTSSGAGSNEIPGWIKNNAGWWADGVISDSDFVSGIQYLISSGIMKITS